MTSLYFYVYVHRRSDTGEIFYVGKGSWSKRKAYGRSHSPENRNPLWKRIVDKSDGYFQVEIVGRFFDECDAFTMERDLISWYGRRDTGSGRLANLTDGGEGAVGRIVSEKSIRKRIETCKAKPRRDDYVPPMLGRRHTEEAKAAISAATSGTNNKMFGQTHSSDTRAKMSEKSRANRATAKKVVDDSTGVVYMSARDAAAAIGIPRGTLAARLSGYVSNKSSLRYM